MARFAFVSHPSWGHIDFGGRSFMRTASELVHRGHQVVWLLIRDETETRASAVEAFLTKNGLVVDWTNGPLSFPRTVSPDHVSALATRLADFDACAIDRYALYAGVAAQRAEKPWAAIGTDGANWTRVPGIGVIPGDASANGAWARSPFLNLSFFPARYYGKKGNSTSHFLGCANGFSTGSKQDPARRQILVTLGTSFAEKWRTRVLEILDQVSRCEGGSWRFLATDARRPDSTWEPYDQAFATARIAIGHGGNAFLWQAMCEGIPAITISSGVGDQTFGARAVARLGLGRALDSAEQLTPAWILQAISELSVDPGAAVKSMSDLLHTGGGYPAAATLLERLSQTRSPVIECAEHCCCRDQ